MTPDVQRDAAVTDQERDAVRKALNAVLINVPRDVEEVLGPFLDWCRDHIEEIEAVAVLELGKVLVAPPA
jgi:hypothetical protein